MTARRFWVSAALTSIASAAALAGAVLVPSDAAATGSAALGQRAVAGWHPTTSNPRVRRSATGSMRVEARIARRPFAAAAREVPVPVGADYDVTVGLRAKRHGTRVCIRAVTQDARAARKCVSATPAWRTVKVRFAGLQKGQRVRVTATGNARFPGAAFELRAAALALTPASARTLVTRCGSKRWDDSCAPGAAPAPPPAEHDPGATCPRGRFHAEYFNGTSLSGTPLVSRCEAAIDFDWGSGSPHPSVPADNFSGRFTGSVDAPAAGNYTFSIRSNDGVRMRVGGRLVLDRWIAQLASYTVTVSLPAGTHPVVIEHFEGTGTALLTYSVSRGSAPATPPATNAAAVTSTATAPTAVVAAAPTAPAATATYFRTVPRGSAGIPRSDAECAALVRRHPWEPRDVVRPGGNWGPTGQYGQTSNLVANRAVPTGSWPFGAFADDRLRQHPNLHARAVKVTGNFTGTTDEIIQWSACKWGLNEDWSRAQAVKESNWWQDARGDWVSGCNSYQSFGIFQVRDMSPNCVTKNWGGMPHTLNMTALNADFFHMIVRGYYEGWFNHWADTAQAVGNERTARGMWFSGGSVASASSYMTSIDEIRSRRDWTNSTTYKAGYPWPAVGN